MKKNDNSEFSELLNKDKAELDRMKVALEVHNYDKKLEFERKRHRTDTVRIIVLALLTSLITLGATYIIKKSDDKRSDINETKASIEKLIDKYDANSEKHSVQMKYAYEISIIDNPHDNKAIEDKKKIYRDIYYGAKDNKGVLSVKESSFRKVDKKVEEKTKLQFTKADSTRYVLEEKEKSEGVLTEKESTQLKKAKTEIVELTESNSFLKEAIRLSEDITEQQTLLIDTLSSGVKSYDGSEIVNSSGVLWFKEGYFVRYNEFRIMLQELDKEGERIRVEVCNEPGSSNCQNPILTNKWISIDKPLSFVKKSRSYMISLKSIGKAGKNPFKSAAYIEISELE